MMFEENIAGIVVALLKRQCQQLRIRKSLLALKSLHHWRPRILQQFFFPDYDLCIQLDVVPGKKVCDI